MNITDLTIVQAHEGLKKKDFSASELCRKYLEKIQKEDGKISAFLIVTRDLAISQAEKVDEKIAKGRSIGILEGIPCAIKDIILVEGVTCTAASKILENYIAPYDATVTKKLKAQGAVILGKTNLDEFAMGSSSENSAYKITKNPHDLTRVPGGSSGGSAAAVAADFCTFALGSDTGGSIRQPASFCGVVGLKPTYGAVSRYGLMAMASSLDQIGPFGKSVDDCRVVFEAIAGKDSLDATSVETKHKLDKADSKSLKIGLPKEYFVEGMDPEVEKIIKRAVAEMEGAGAKIEEISLPHTEYGLAVYYIIMPAEISANLARYDGIKYGYSAVKESKSEIKNLLDVYLQSREDGLGPEVRRRIMLGTYTLSAGYYDAYYLRAQKVRNLIRQDFSDAFEKVDVIFAPVSPTPAFKIGEKANDPLKMYLSDIFTVSVNLAGLPAISVPCPVKNSPSKGPPGAQDVGVIFNGTSGMIGKGLPVGLQIIGRPFEENKIFNIAKILEQQYAL